MKADGIRLAVLVLSLAGPASAQAPDMLQAKVAEAIRGNGFNCSRAVYVDPAGEDHYGKAFKVWCLGSEPGTTAIFGFRVTLRPNDTVMVAPER